MNDNNQKQGSLYISISIFFLGFYCASNGVFIPFCKKYFSIDQFQSQLVDFSFLWAYYFGLYYYLCFQIVNRRIY